MGFIYKITNTVSGKCYIGETAQDDPEKRWKQHLKKINKNQGCPALRDAIKKYGLDKFKFELLIICFDEDRHKYEKEYIIKYNSQVPNGYNILPGGQVGKSRLGIKHTPEAIKKMVEKLKKFRENNPNYYETYREKHQESIKNINYSECIKSSEKFKKASEKRKIEGNSKERNCKISNTLIKYFENNREKHRESMTKALGKKIIQYSKDNNIVKEYNSIADASRLTNINISNIQHVLYGRSKTAGGFIWKYADIKEPKDLEQI